jgi:hypothetical protein
VHQLNKCLALVALLVSLFGTPIALGAIQVCAAAETAIFGYPYETTQGGGSGAQYDACGSRFTLNGEAVISSISALMSGGWNPTSQGDHYIYRLAIYSDDNGKVGALISQTQIGTFVGASDIAGYSQGIWKNASFKETVHLSSGNYWLMAVHNASNYVSIHSEVPAKGYTTVTSVIGGMDFPASLSSPVYSENFVLCLYASGEGSDSVSTPIKDYSHPIVTRLTAGCTINNDNEIEITGNLTANKIGIASAPILLSYAENVNTTWHQISTVNTDADGAFTTTWDPSSAGSYVINATYAGDSTHMPAGTVVNVIVTSVAVDKPQTIFSVESNSTVTDLGFNSETDQLSFSVSGASGTTGYAEIYVSKNLVNDPSKIQASIDEVPADFTVSSTKDSWILYFSYHHSSHNIVFNLSKAENLSVPEIPPTALPIIIVTLIAAASLLVALQRRHPPHVSAR